MLFLRRARVPAALLPPALLSAPVDPLEPAVLCDLDIDGDRIAALRLSPATPVLASRDVVDAGGSLVFPGFIDAHTHLDKAHTWWRAPNRTGTFQDALETLGRDKENWTPTDLRKRAGFALRCAYAHGTRLIRTHVDTWLPHGEVSHSVMAELRAEWKGRIELQTVPLCGGDSYAGANGEKTADMALRYGASALGAFLQMNPNLPAQIDRLLEVAKSRGVGIDLHVDENGNPAAEVLRQVAEGVLRHKFTFPVVCGHCCSLAVQAPERQKSTIALVKEAGIGVISLPQCNLYLQDRRPTGFPRTPMWRGLTLIQDLLDAGIPVACASDNVRDAFHAYGDLDMAEVYATGLRLAHLDSRLAESVRLVTSMPADLVGRPELGRVAPGAPAHLVIFAAKRFSELLSRPAVSRRRVDGEEVHVPPLPDYAELGEPGRV